MQADQTPSQQSQVPEPFGSASQPPPPPVPVAVQQKQTLPVKTSGMAVASLILGILGFITCAITSVIGLILGIVSLSAIRKSAGRLGGRGLAIGGIAVSGFTILIIPLVALLAAILVPAVSRARGVAINAVSMANVRQLSLAAMMYAEEHNAQLPDPDSWKEQLTEYMDGNPDEVLSSPYEHKAGCGFAMNSLLVGSAEGRGIPLELDQIVNPARTVLFFEARSDGPLAGGPELLPEEPRGPRGYIISFVDGHVENVANDQLDDLIWSPGAEDRGIEPSWSSP